MSLLRSILFTVVFLFRFALPALAHADNIEQEDPVSLENFPRSICASQNLEESVALTCRFLCGESPKAPGKYKKLYVFALTRPLSNALAKGVYTGTSSSISETLQSYLLEIESKREVATKERQALESRKTQIKKIRGSIDAITFKNFDEEAKWIQQKLQKLQQEETSYQLWLRKLGGRGDTTRALIESTPKKIEARDPSSGEYLLNLGSLTLNFVLETDSSKMKTIKRLSLVKKGDALPLCSKNEEILLAEAAGASRGSEGRLSPYYKAFLVELLQPESERGQKLKIMAEALAPFAQSLAEGLRSARGDFEKCRQAASASLQKLQHMPGRAEIEPDRYLYVIALSFSGSAVASGSEVSANDELRTRRRNFESLFTKLVSLNTLLTSHERGEGSENGFWNPPSAQNYRRHLLYPGQNRGLNLSPPITAQQESDFRNLLETVCHDFAQDAQE